MKDYMTIYKEWLENPYFDEATKEVLPGLGAEGLEVLIGTQQGVYVEVVGSVVAVVGVGLEDVRL